MSRTTRVISEDRELEAAWILKKLNLDDTYATIKPAIIHALKALVVDHLEPPYINNRPTVRSDLSEEYSFNPRINEHKPVEYRKKARRDAMEKAAAQWRHHHGDDST